MTTETEIAVQQKEKAENPQKSPDSKGAALDAPSTRPFEGYTYLKKDWVDHEDGIESVTLNTTLGKISLPANWNTLESFVMMPEWGTVPLRRSWVVRLPTHFEEQIRYLFHYYFQIQYSDGSEKISDTFTQLIIPKDVEYIDHSGSCTHIIMHWSIDGWSYPQNTELEVEGVEWGGDFSVSRAPYRSGDPLYEKERFLGLKKIKPPRRFFARVWAPKGSRLHYCFKLVSADESGRLFSRWDNNCGKDFKMTV